MPELPDTPEVVTELAERCRTRGGRALLVGGCVRDHMMRRPTKDWDVEVYGIAADVLEQLLRPLGHVNTVGRSFGVFKLTRSGEEIDVSLPRRDSNAGPGHRGIRVEGDPDMDVADAARRRDLTVNAILLDPLTGEVIDPWNGRADLKAGVLRAVHPATFLEDPLRALRVVQLAARLRFAVDPDLVALCRTAPLEELPAERIQEEWRKLLLRAPRPSEGLAVARATHALHRVFPEVVDAPEVDAALDHAATLALRPEARQLAAVLAAWLHRTGRAGSEATLDRLWLHKVGGYPLRDRVLAAVVHWPQAPETDAQLRHLSTVTELELTLSVRWAITQHPADKARLAGAFRLGIAHDAPAPLLLGRHLADLPIEPGPRMGELLQQVYELQLDGEVTTGAQALAAARRLLS